MLNVYIGNNINIKVHKYNDAWFDLNRQTMQEDTVIKDLMQRIDNSTYIDAYRMKSKFDDYAISTELLSTGCKTAINVYRFPQHCFYVGGCGENALQQIMQFKRGNIYICDFFIPLSFVNDIMVHLEDTSLIIHNSKELESVMVKNL